MSFSSKRITRSYKQKINSTPDKIFPLLCPQREKDWLDGWDYEMVYSISGVAEQDSIFKTKHNGEVDTIWVITKHDPVNYEIEFVRMTWETVVVKIEIKLFDNHNNTTDVNIAYTFTSITEKGNEFIDGSSEKQFMEMMRWWEKSMNYYLESGTKLMALHFQKFKKKKEEPKKEGLISSTQTDQQKEATN